MGKLHENTVFIRCMGQKHAPLACTTDGCSACGGRWGSSGQLGSRAGSRRGPSANGATGGGKKGKVVFGTGNRLLDKQLSADGKAPGPAQPKKPEPKPEGGAPHRITCMQACALADVVSCCMRMTMHARAGEEGGRVQVQGLHGESALAPGLGNRGHA